MSGWPSGCAYVCLFACLHVLWTRLQVGVVSAGKQFTFGPRPAKVSYYDANVSFWQLFNHIDVGVCVFFYLYFQIDSCVFHLG